MGPIPRGFRSKQEGEGSSTKGYRTRPVTRRAIPASQIHSYKQCQSQEGKQDSARGGREVLEGNRHSTARQAHSHPVRRSQKKRGKCTSAAPDGNGTT